MGRKGSTKDFMIDTNTSQAHIRALLSPRLLKGKPLITPQHLAGTAMGSVTTYTPPPTDAQSVNPWNGQLSPITSETALILFCLPGDVTRLLPLVREVDPQTRVFDGQGVVCPEIQYGSDGRKVMCVQGIVMINGATYSYQAAFGVIIAASYWGPMWNGMHQPPYAHLTADPVDSSDAQIDWTH